MTEGDYLCDEQHGFVSVTQLLVTLELWTEWLDRGEPFNVVYLDFDSVSYILFLQKLRAYGVCGNLLNWIQNFLGPILFFIFINDLQGMIRSTDI